MTEPLAVEDVRARFIEAAKAYWRELQAGNSKGANKQTATNNTLVDALRQQQRDVEVLEPLLDHAEQAVRFAAASYLLKSTEVGRARSVLEALAEEGKGLIRPSARLRLDMWRQERSGS